MSPTLITTEVFSSAHTNNFRVGSLLPRTKKKNLGPGWQRQINNGLPPLQSPAWRTLKDNEEAEILSADMAKREVTKHEKNMNSLGVVNGMADRVGQWKEQTQKI